MSENEKLVELSARCQEILEWDRTGILKGDALRAYADEHCFVPEREEERLNQAENDTKKQAMEMVVTAATALTAAEARIKMLEKRSDCYGVALMMINAGCSNPARFAGNILDDKEPTDIDIEDELP